MSFRITGLPLEPFQHLFGLSDQELAARNVIRYIANSKPGFPDRVELRDAEPGESVLLLNYMHQPAPTPFQATHAIFVSESSQNRYDRVNEVPPAMRERTLSLRAFDNQGLIVTADVIDGKTVESLIERQLDNPEVAYIQAHFAGYGCYASRIERIS
jgi:hypothetical protein